MKNILLSLITVAMLGSVVAVQAGKKGAAKSAPVTSKTFSVTGAKIEKADGTDGTLADLKAGDKVGVAYTDANGTLTAQKVHVLGDQKPEAGGKKGEGHKHAGGGNELHAHGVITAVDATGNTITVDVFEHHKK